MGRRGTPTTRCVYGCVQLYTISGDVFTSEAGREKRERARAEKRERERKNERGEMKRGREEDDEREEEAEETTPEEKKDDEESEDEDAPLTPNRRQINEEYKVWKKNTPFLYDLFLVSAFLVFLSLCCWSFLKKERKTTTTHTRHERLILSSSNRHTS